MFLGVCGGIGRYLGIDSTVARVLFTLVTLFTGIIPGILAYPILELIIPTVPQESPTIDTGFGGRFGSA
jgi:phage shock protein C